VKNLTWVLLFLACNPSRDDADAAIERTLDLVLAERQDLEANRALRKAEQDELISARSAFRPVTSAELLSLAGTDAKVIKASPAGFYELVSISAPGARSAAIAFARAALARSKSVNLTELKLAEKSWLVTVAVLLSPPSPKRATGSVFTPAADTSWCYSSCRERQRRIVEKSAKLTALDASLGALVTLARDRKLLHELQRTDAKFIGDEVLPVLDSLESASWLPGEGAMGFAPRDLRITAPAEAAPGCAQAFSSCRYDDAHHALVIELPGP